MDEIHSRLKKLANTKDAENAQRFFKTGPGEYGEGDLFIGVRVPVLRKLSKEYQAITIEQAIRILKSPIHEKRMLALFILVRIYSREDKEIKGRIYELYLKHTSFINSWDLIDTTAQHIVGHFLFTRSKAPLYQLMKSNSLWERRISILSTFYFIKREKYTVTLKIAKQLLNDKEDLMHKAVGWMLREVGNRNVSTEEHFLKQHYKQMPRTMLRYAIEKFPEKKRKRYLQGKI